MHMRIVGGGPGGLALAALVRRAIPSSRVEVYESRQAGETYGHGVVVPSRHFAQLDAQLPHIARRLERRSVRWNELEVRHRGHRLRSKGFTFLGVKRSTLLGILRQEAEAAGVHIYDNTPVVNPSALSDCDVLVAADGVNSTVRSSWRSEFGVTERTAYDAFLWLSVPQPFDALTFIFERSPHGWLGVHAYPHGGSSTFIVETSLDTARALGSGARLEKALQDTFSDHVGDRLQIQGAEWHRFTRVQCERWVNSNIALIGDAAHSTHYSLGSGTALALSDAVQLASDLCRFPDVESALSQYEMARKSAMASYVRMSDTSEQWWSSLDVLAENSPGVFAGNFMTRVPEVTRRSLCVLDRHFVRAIEEGRTEHANPRRWPLTIGPARIVGRLFVEMNGRRPYDRANIDHADVGMILCAVDARSMIEGEDRLRIVRRQLAAAGEPRPLAALLAAVPTSIRFDPTVALGPLDIADVLIIPASTVPDAWWTKWPSDAIWPLVEPGADLLDDARLLSSSGAPALAVKAGTRHALLHSCEMVRATTGKAVLMLGAARNDDDADTLIMSGRADICGAPRRVPPHPELIRSVDR